MNLEIEKSIISGTVTPPPSKSHTIRAIILASMADGKSTIKNPLLSLDGVAPIQGCRQLGAKINSVDENGSLVIQGTNGDFRTPDDVIDVNNSGTSLYFLSALCTQLNGYTVLKGDQSINKRPIQPLLHALNKLGAHCFTTRNTGTPPVVIKGKLVGGETPIEGITSQYTSALLLASPFSSSDTIIHPQNLQERPYVDLTIDYLKMSGVKVAKINYKSFIVTGGQTVRPFTKTIPGDFSSAGFLIGAGILCADNLRITNLDFNDYQADKLLVDILKAMGGDIQKSTNNKELIIKQSNLLELEIDLSQSPDLLPILAVIATQAEGRTIINNVAHARIKETDRISVMCTELKKLGANIKELPDGLLINGGTPLKGGICDSNGDHRVAMALTVAGLVTDEKTVVNGIQAVKATYPNFIKDLQSINAKIQEKNRNLL